MTRIDTRSRLANTHLRTSTWLGAALLLTGCYDPAGKVEDAGTDAADSSGSDGDDTGTSPTAGTGATTSDDDPSVGDDDSSDGGSTAADDDSGGDDSSTGEDSGDDSSGSSTGEPADTTAPQIVSVAPADGAAGVASDVDIVITFDEAMDTAATAAAFESADLGSYSASWNDDGTVLTIEPDAALAYANGDDPDDVVALAYAFAIATTAADVAGNQLEAETTSSFTTSRRITTTLAADVDLVGAVRSDGTLNTGSGGDALAGDRSDNTQLKGFIGLVLDDVPTDAEIESATLEAEQYLAVGTAYASLGDLSLHHIVADALDADAFGAIALADLGVFSDSATFGPRAADIGSSVAVDLAAGRSRSLYRLQFPIASDNDEGFDQSRFDAPSGSIVYLVD